MRNWITLLMTLLVGFGSYANANMGQVCFEAGYRRDNIDWRLRFPSNDPIVRSSFKFKDLDIFQIGIHGRSTLGCNFYVRGSAYWGWILDGKFDRSFSGKVDNGHDDSRFQLGFDDRNNTTVDDRYVFGVGGAIGYPFYFCDCTMVLAPVIGYAFDEQNVHAEDLGFGFDHYGYGSDGRRGCCRNSFVSRWYGPFAGLDFDWRPWNSCFNVWAELEYHWGSFRGRRAHIDDFGGVELRNPSSHKATAWVFGAGFDYDLCNCWTVGLSVKIQNWAANRHHKFCDKRFDRDYFDRKFCDHRTRTNNKWRSYAINLTFGRDF